MNTLDKNYNFHESESKWQNFWQEKKLYQWKDDEPRENNFVVDTPPPTVSGQLHIGHVYSYTQTDFIVRFQRMIGKNIFYPMGFDDNGLPTERLVEKVKQIKGYTLERQEFINICKEVVAIEERKFYNLFNKIALSVDWSLLYQTISPLSQKISQMSFLDLVTKGEIYRESQPILWDPVDQTALAQADVEDKEKSSYMNDIIFTTEQGEKIVIATTRPELLPACVAVLYHPDDERYKHLRGSFAISPLFFERVPILEDDLVQPEKGTGLVMCCTFGDKTDILWWRKHNLPTKIIINKQGKIDNIIFTDNCIEIDKARAFALQMQSLKVGQARSKIIEILQEHNLLQKQTEILHNVACAERSGAPLEILMTKQWFVRAIDHKKSLMSLASELNWYPDNMKIRLENWVRGISWDWCISRQRYFGVPFPVWYSKRLGEEGKVIFAQLEDLPVDPIKDLPFGYTRDEVEADVDVMDTWATSAISPQLNTHAVSKDFAVDFARHQKLFPVDLRPQAHEIIRTWTFYTMLKAHLHENTLPWKNIMISGWCLAEDRSKMSKSKGNVVEPEKLLQEYGADVIRYWSANSKLGADTAYSEDIMKNGKRLVNKLWNAAKFSSVHFDKILLIDKTLMLTELHNKIEWEVDLWLLAKLQDTLHKAENAFTNYEYSNALLVTEEFFREIFCDNYLEIIKIRAYNQEGVQDSGQYSAILTLYYSMKIILKLFAPFLPHITEEIYNALYIDQDSQDISIHARFGWPSMNDFREIKEGDKLIEILNLIRKYKAMHNLSVKAPVKIVEVLSDELSNNLTIDLKNVIAAEKVIFVQSLTAPVAIEANGLALAIY